MKALEIALTSSGLHVQQLSEIKALPNNLQSFLSIKAN